MKNHRWQWCPEEKTLPSHRLKKMTIVEVYTVTIKHSIMLLRCVKMTYVTVSMKHTMKLLDCDMMTDVTVRDAKSDFNSTDTNLATKK